jgi:uncharacterized protein
MPLHEKGITIVAMMRDEFFAIGVPIVAVIMLIPFISGAVTGIAVGYVGASFPLVFALLGDHPPFHILVATTSLAYACGNIGMMLSPVHICLIVTNEYFKAPLSRCYRYLWAPGVVMIIAAIAISGAYYLLLK